MEDAAASLALVVAALAELAAAVALPAASTAFCAAVDAEATTDWAWYLAEYSLP